MSEPSRGSGVDVEDGRGYGYRWVVVVSAFFVMLLTDGCTFTFGVLLLEFLEEFGDSRAATTVVGSLTVGVFHLVGPVAGLLVDVCGARTVSVLGAVISAGGFLGAAFASDIVTLAACYGVLGGIGFGFMYLPATACVVQHFEDKRALAMGIAVCGAGAGTFIMSLLLRYLIDTYTWRGAVLILAAIELNGIPLGLLLVPKPATKTKTDPGSDCKDQEVVASECNDSEIVSSECKNANEVPSKCKDSEKVASASKYSGQVASEIKYPEKGSFEYNGSDKVFSECKNFEKVSSECKNSEKVKYACNAYEKVDSECKYFDDVHSECKNSGKMASACQNSQKVTSKCKNSENVTSKCTDHKLIFNSQLKDALQRCHKGLLENVHLLRDVRCVCFLLSTVVVALAFMIPFTLLPDQAVHLGMSKLQASWLLSAMGISNILSRITIGCVADVKCVNRLLLFGVLLLLAGVSTAVSPLLQTFHTKLIYSCVFGFLIGGYVVLIPVVLADLFGADLIEKSFGLHMLAIGIPAIAALPLGGWMVDRTGSYTVSFVVAGSELVVSEFILCLPWMLRRLRHTHTVKISD